MSNELSFKDANFSQFSNQVYDILLVFRTMMAHSFKTTPPDEIMFHTSRLQTALAAILRTAAKTSNQAGGGDES